VNRCRPFRTSKYKGQKKKEKKPYLFQIEFKSIIRLFVFHFNRVSLQMGRRRKNRQVHSDFSFDKRFKMKHKKPISADVTLNFHRKTASSGRSLPTSFNSIRFNYDLSTQNLNEIKFNRKAKRKRCCVVSRYCCLALTLLGLFIAIGLAAMFIGIFTPKRTTTTTTVTTTTTTTATTTTSN